MESKREQAYTRCVSIVLCLLVFSSSPQAMVLCIGRNGHVALEASDSSCCGHLPWVASSTSVLTFGETGPSATDDDCGSCLDIPLSSGSAETVTIPQQTQTDLTASVQFEPLLVTRACFSQFTHDLKFLILPSCFTPSDAIILLI